MICFDAPGPGHTDELIALALEAARSRSIFFM